MTQAEAEATTAHLRQTIAACAEVLLRHALVEVVADSPGWIDSGVDLQAGDTVSLLATGSAHMAGNAGLSFAPQSLLWYRIRPGGQIAKFPAPTTTFTAPCGGRLEFVVNFPGAWLDPAGGLAPDWPRQAGAGAFVVAVLVWKGAAE